MITINRGTTNDFVVVLTYEDGNTYLIGADDKLVFGIKKHIKQEDCIVTKVIGAGTYDEEKGGYVVSLTPEDTQGLECGNYVYDVGYQKSTGEYYIVRPCDTFKIDETVTEKV